jgi:hypothetical protein
VLEHGDVVESDTCDAEVSCLEAAAGAMYFML